MVEKEDWIVVERGGTRHHLRTYCRVSSAGGAATGGILGQASGDGLIIFNKMESQPEVFLKLRDSRSECSFSFNERGRHPVMGATRVLLCQASIPMDW